ncbi:hypothetical protein BCV69DRAFT_311592 [Microstroma glucosiphilum]|uniref:Pectin lyase-like protein n=1 Tax=Pseudomicrostroma glucosiphilum TaxID=1684307 RepID=A0A316UFH3_9BASI|nr:hypothetical protein BCV69DRAFT_311592 [Pseudomicrostroma glucosiphilum]PWN21885.1 hypothetical protein BCV69DRAFT_311592 [Pseudomicrostroma glucosiphilum]
MSHSFSGAPSTAVEASPRGLLHRLRSVKRRSLPASHGSASTFARLQKDEGQAIQEAGLDEVRLTSDRTPARLLASEAVDVAPAAGAEEDPLTASEAIRFGSQVLTFTPDQKDSTIQSRIDQVYKEQVKSHFGSNRWAFLFKPGRYNLDIKLGFYTTCHGLGASPSEVVITGSVRVKGDFLPKNNSTLNFWRGVENLTIVPALKQDDRKVVWAVSQGTFFRRIHVKGDMVLSDGDGWSSGGYIADCVIDGTITNGTQQQFFFRNTSMGSFVGGSYSQVFVGCKGAPKEDWPSKPYSVTKATPRVKEKPYITYEDKKYWLNLPRLREGSGGPSWSKSSTNRGSHLRVRLATFHIAEPSRDNATTLNAALHRGKSILFLPGVYQLNFALQVANPDTCLLGLGLATLRPAHGTPCIITADVDGVTLAGLLLEAGPHPSSTLCSIGDAKASTPHRHSPTMVQDVFVRVGGAIAGRCHSQLLINLRDSIMDNIWLWRADHGEGADWYTNQCTVGCIVEARNVTGYALFVEHNQGFQVLWNGNGGAVYFYQSELPYDPPGSKIWSHSNRKGFPSYKVAPAVTSHYAKGLAIYCVFKTPGVQCHTAVEQPLTTATGDDGRHTVEVRHVTLGRFGGAEGTGIRHVINGRGEGVGPTRQRVRLLDAYR